MKIQIIKKKLHSITTPLYRGKDASHSWPLANAGRLAYRGKLESHRQQRCRWRASRLALARQRCEPLSHTHCLAIAKEPYRLSIADRLECRNRGHATVSRSVLIFINITLIPLRIRTNSHKCRDVKTLAGTTPTSGEIDDYKRSGFLRNSGLNIGWPDKKGLKEFLAREWLEGGR